MTNQSMNHPARNDPAYDYQLESDEISLIDLWLVLARRKKLIGIIVLISIISGLVIAFSKTSNYKYYTTIEIGSKILEGKIQLIEEPKQLLAKIEGSYIPLALNEVKENKQTDETLYDLEASIPKDSQVIELSGKGPLSEQEQYVKLLNRVVESIKADHDNLLKVLREEESIKRNKLLSGKDALDDKYKLIQNKLKRLEQSEALLKEQIKATKELIDSATQNREKAIRQAKDNAHAMTVMMIDNGLQNNRATMAELENKLYILLANDRDALEKELADVTREKNNVSLDVEKLLLQEGTYKNTRVILNPIRSQSPVGQSKRLILVLSVLLGFFVAIFAAFFAEFIAKVKEKEAAQSMVEKS